MQELLGQTVEDDDYDEEDGADVEEEQLVVAATFKEVPKPLKPLIKELPKLKLKSLRAHLKYAYLGNHTLPVLIAAKLTKQHLISLLQVL